eukprot:CAMPEP_0119061156 /NCGR_PEP_ID=MMETSP1178-20130426/4992_1 /TAXON_ID=33656 /ORGANISM="unid sp, Strain CCMP2000" /LENGTH=110 /DNA_ID=CAMNT_0007042337 /DNA_START=62 /DNA_END=394 /DNA_ORIENTATION=-
MLLSAASLSSSTSASGVSTSCGVLGACTAAAARAARCLSRSLRSTARRASAASRRACCSSFSCAIAAAWSSVRGGAWTALCLLELALGGTTAADLKVLGVVAPRFAAAAA